MRTPEAAQDPEPGPAPWLVVVDPQVVFAEAPSPWAAPGFARIVPVVAELARRYAPRVLLTRWVPPGPGAAHGSWADYLRAWPFADRPTEDTLFDVVPELAALPELAGAPVVSLPTFGKYGPELTAHTGTTPRLVLAGVSTDCCVLSTALAAVDAGAWVEVVASACAGSDEAAHERALALMGGYAPQVTITA